MATTERTLDPAPQSNTPLDLVWVRATIAGLLSMRDIVRVWAEAAVPATQAQAATPA